MTKKYRDFSLNFHPNPATGDVSLVSDEKSISQSIKNIILTDRYEIPFTPTYGGNVRRMLFELNTPFISDSMRETIITSIENFEPRAQILDVIVKNNTIKDGVDVTILYRARTTTQDIVINFFLDRVI